MSELFSLDAVLPEQFTCPRRESIARHGASALMAAVLEDAIDCFQHQFTKKGHQAQRLGLEAEKWLFTDDEDWLFSFLNICAALRLDPHRLRQQLVRWRQSPPPPQWQYRRTIVLAQRLAHPSAAGE